MECLASPSTSGKTRKRTAHPENWKQNIAKRQRYSPKESPNRPRCQHLRKGVYKCESITMRDVMNFHAAFYKYHNKETQDAFLLKYCVPVIPKRKRPKNKKHHPKTIHTNYSIYSVSQKKKITICQKAFLGILNITKHRVQYIAKKFVESGGQAVKEKRGGDHKSHLFTEKKNAVMLFINMFHIDEAHYCRGHSERRYLPAELSINKMWKMYNKQPNFEANLKVKKGLFRKIFNNNYNLGFGSPRTDVCSTCILLLEKIKRESDEAQKQRLMVEHRVHKLKAKAFFNLVREERPNLKTFSFDCEKNLPLPKTPDQITYYSRQLYLYNCTIVEGSSKTPLTTQNVFAYCWTEDQYAKGANAIASIVYHRLMNTNLTDISTIRLIADGCPGQNKNSIMIAMCSKWLSSSAPDHVQRIEIVFPIVGHSFIPPDRVFAHVEKDVRKLECILRPEDYLEIIGTYSTIVRMGSDCEVLNFKSGMSSVIKDVGSWHFQFKHCKRFLIQRSKEIGNVVIQGEVHYTNNLGVLKKITRKNKKASDLNPEVITQNIVRIKPAKLVDVKKLLTTHFGN
ncbi:unnamed protein product [Parnassius mnemosyne]|uniref:DUF7869 domain-containing protein n=1 Tax=Parnassius mnemosyne TaxID=213953 RepID=A0AAV1K5F3_9NEOP